MEDPEDSQRAADGSVRAGIARCAEESGTASVPDGGGASAARSIRFEPMGCTIEARPGQRIYDLALSAGLPLAQSCGGEGICGRCGVRIVEGGDALGPEGAPERRRKQANRVDPTLRLACLTTVRGQVVVTTDYW